MKKIFGAFVALILIEIATFILIGNSIGIFNTLLLIVLTSGVGILVAKKQGLQSVQNIRGSIEQGEAPGIAMIDTLMIFIGGILLCIPGFITDILGFLLLFSLTRKLFKPAIFYWLRKKMKSGQIFIINK